MYEKWEKKVLFASGLAKLSGGSWGERPPSLQISGRQLTAVTHEEGEDKRGKGST